MNQKLHPLTVEDLDGDGWPGDVVYAVEKAIKENCYFIKVSDGNISVGLTGRGDNYLTEWSWDFARALLAKAHAHYQAQIASSQIKEDAE